MCLALLSMALLAGCSQSGRSGATDNGDGGNTGDGEHDGAPSFAFDLTSGPGGDLASCDNGATLSGKVFAPNGLDPVPGATVYIPADPVAPFAATVTCDLCDKVPPAITKTTSATDGSFSLAGVPDGDVVVVIQLGRFRRVLHFQVMPCEQRAVPARFTRLPTKNGELDPGDHIPRIAVATGDYDQIECVLKRMGIAQLDLYDDRGGVNNPPALGSFDSLLSDPKKMLGYDVLFVNCTNNEFESSLGRKAVLDNLTAYAAAGGRLYLTDWAYDLVEQVPAFAPYMCFEPQRGGNLMCGPAPQTAMNADSNSPYSNKALIKDARLADWLALFPNVIDGQKRVSVDFSFVVVDEVANDPKAYPTTVWVEGDTAQFGVKPMTVTFEYNQCGRLHYSTYNTEPNGVVPENGRYPNNCKPAFSPQERILEYLVFEIASCINTSRP